MDSLIQTSVCSIIYGTFRGEENQELFRCPRENDEIDIPRYVNENRALLGFVDDTDIDSVGDVAGKKLIGYFRLYYRRGWAGSWLPPFGSLSYVNGEPDKKDCIGVNKIIEWIMDQFPHGCNYEMKEYLKAHFNPWGCEGRYLIRPKYSDFYKVAIDTSFGNDDYPVRIYVYR